MTNKFDLKAYEWDQNPARVKIAEIAMEKLSSIVPLKPNMQVLDYGSGTGLMMLGLAPEVGHVTGLDSSQGMLDVLKSKIKNTDLNNVHAEQHNIETDPLPEAAFDLAVTNMTMHHISDTKMFLGKLFKALKPGGHVCITDLESEDGSFHREHDPSIKHFGFDKSDVKKWLLEVGFEIKLVETYHKVARENSEGIRYYPLFMAIARKKD